MDSTIDDRCHPWSPHLLRNSRASSSPKRGTRTAADWAARSILIETTSASMQDISVNPLESAKAKHRHAIWPAAGARPQITKKLSIVSVSASVEIRDQ